MLGIAFSFLACMGTTAGMLMQKYAHNLDDSVPGNAARKKRLWWTSVVLIVGIPVPLDVAALSMAAQDTGTTVIKPTDVSGNGRWIRIII